MKVKILMVSALLIIALSAGCGGSSSGSSDGGGGSTDTAAGEAVAGVASVVTSGLSAVTDSMTASGGSSMVISKASTLSDCTFYSSYNSDPGTELPTTTTAELATALTTAKSYTCEYDCSVAGTKTITAQNINDVEYFPNILDGIILTIVYADDCVIDSEICSAELDIDGTHIIRITDMNEDPCSMTFNFSSTDFAVQDIPATYDITLSISGNTACGSENYVYDCAGTASLDDYVDPVILFSVSSDSSMTVGGTSYTSTDVCESIANDDCTL